MGSFPYYSHTTPIRIPKGMGMVWEAYHKGGPIVGGPWKIPLVAESRGAREAAKRIAKVAESRVARVAEGRVFWE